MSLDKMDISVLSPVIDSVVEISEASMRQLLPIEKMDPKDYSNPFFNSTDPDFYNFGNGSLLGGSGDYTLDSFLASPFSMDEILEEGGTISFQQSEDRLLSSDREETESVSISMDHDNGNESDDGEANDHEQMNQLENVEVVDQTGRKVIKKKIYICQEPACDTWFVRASRFHEHQLSHNNLRPFRCSTCIYKTKWKSDVKKHIKKQIQKGDVSHTDARMIVSHDFEKDKLKKYNLFHQEKLIYCVDGTNKVPETGSSRNYYRVGPPPPAVRAKDAPLEKINSKNKRNKSGSKKLKVKVDHVSSPQATLQIQNQIQCPTRIQTQNLLAQFSDSEPVLVHQTLPIPAQEFVNLVGFNKY